MVAIPSPGELVDFTTNHDKVREALLRIVGSADQLRSAFNLSITEAMAIYLRSDMQRATDAILRSCATASPGDLDRCERDVQRDAGGEIVAEIRRRTDASVSALHGLFKNLAALDGPKSVI